jgi:hypothetical protein
MTAVFVELPAFDRHRPEYLTDEQLSLLQEVLMYHPEAGDVIPDSGGLRKLRFADSRRRKGGRGGLRVIYFWWSVGSQFWLFAIYRKGDLDDLTSVQRRLLKRLLKAELEQRG